MFNADWTDFSICFHIRFHAISLNYKAKLCAIFTREMIDEKVREVEALLATSDQQQFEEEWKLYVDRPEHKDAQAALSMIYQNKTKLAACYTNRFLNFGAQSTQRVEKMNDVSQSNTYHYCHQHHSHSRT